MDDKIKKQKEHLSEIIKAGHDTALYLCLIQDFMSGANSYGYLRLLGLYQVEEEAARKLSNSGQRYPGIVAQVMKSNSSCFASINLPHLPLQQFEVFRGDFIILTHAPSHFIFDRFYISRICASHDKYKCSPCEESLAGMNVFSMIVRICCIDDSEHGPYRRIRKDSDASIILGD